MRLSEDRRSVSPVTMRWWEHEGIWFHNEKRVTNNFKVDQEYQPSLTKYTIVMEPNGNVATARGWNTTTHKISACYRVAEAD